MDSKYSPFQLLVFITFLPAICLGNRNFSAYTAAYYGSPDCKGTQTGACGFGEYGRNINDGQVSGVSRLYLDGAGCGACYQVKCTNPALCSDNGTTVVVTDYGAGPDFILSTSAYARLSRPGLAENLFSFGVVDVVFNRVPCRYSNSLAFKVQEHSRNPGYLAVVPLYKSGVYDIIAVEIWQEDCKEWKPMRRVYGTVFDKENPPCTAITLRYQTSVNGSANSTWVQLNNVMPADWKSGYSYDTGISA